MQSIGITILNRTATPDNATNDQVYLKNSTDSFKKSTWPRKKNSYTKKEWPETKTLFKIKIPVDVKVVKLIFCLYFPNNIFKVFLFYNKSERMFKSKKSLVTEQLIIMQ